MIWVDQHTVNAVHDEIVSALHTSSFRKALRICVDCWAQMGHSTVYSLHTFWSFHHVTVLTMDAVLNGSNLGKQACFCFMVGWVQRKEAATSEQDY